MTILTLINVANSIMTVPYFLWLFTFLVRPYRGFRPDQTTFRWIFKKLLWTVPTTQTLNGICIWTDPHEGMFWRVLGIINVIWSIWIYRKYRNDDDFWNKLRNKAKEKIVELRGKLVVVPLEPIPITN